MCEFNMGNHLDSVPALAAFNPVVGRHLIKYNNSEDVTAIISVGVGFKTTTDLIFVALTENHTDHFLDKVRVFHQHLIATHVANRVRGKLYFLYLLVIFSSIT